MLTERHVYALLRLCLAVCMLAGVTACGTLYLAQAARGEWQVMRERRPIDAVVADARTPPSVRTRLEEVRAARDFASRELGLPDNASYRSYADIGRPFVVWNVVATPEFSIEPQRWCFPIAGCVAYRGYFNERGASAFARNLATKGFDVAVSGVPAYSTLGKVADPVLNTMLGYGDAQLAAMIFHELSHQLMYVAGDSSFSEAFAVTVEQAGLERWLNLRGRRDQLTRYEAGRAHQREYVELFMRRRATLASLFTLPLDPGAMRERKRAIFASLAREMRALERRQGVPSPYAEWLEDGMNNAHLASVATYFDCVAGFERMLAAEQGNLSAFYASARRLAGLPRAERHAQLCAEPR
jgi:predicted aminopeptidase